MVMTILFRVHRACRLPQGFKSNAMLHFSSSPGKDTIRPTTFKSIQPLTMSVLQSMFAQYDDSKPDTTVLVPAAFLTGLFGPSQAYLLWLAFFALSAPNATIFSFASMLVDFRRLFWDLIVGEISFEKALDVLFFSPWLDVDEEFQEWSEMVWTVTACFLLSVVVSYIFRIKSEYHVERGYRHVRLNPPRAPSAPYRETLFLDWNVPSELPAPAIDPFDVLEERYFHRRAPRRQENGSP